MEDKQWKENLFQVVFLLVQGEPSLSNTTETNITSTVIF